MTARVGPVAAKFKGKLTLSDLKPPQSYSIAFEGQGGVAGFGKGGAQVQLAPEGNATRLSYQVKASVGGKLAQIGSRLVDAAARKLADDSLPPSTRKSPACTRRRRTRTPRARRPPSRTCASRPRPARCSASSLAFFAAGALVVSLVALIALF
jgi:hypothetical protein